MELLKITHLKFVVSHKFSTCSNSNIMQNVEVTKLFNTKFKQPNVGKLMECSEQYCQRMQKMKHTNHRHIWKE